MLGGSVNAVATALVTGGTSGIGAAFVRALAARGDDVVIVARDTARMEATAAELSAKHGVRVEALTADLAKKADVDRVAARLESQDAPIELLINNAGFGLHSTLLDADYSEHERALDVMGLAVLVLGGAAGRAMKARGHGRIINVSSISAFIAQGGYSPVKAYSKVYSEGLANELSSTADEFRPALNELGGVMDDIANYERPERLPNGDILIRRRADAPPPPPLEELQRLLPQNPQGAPSAPKPVTPTAPQTDL